MGLDFNKILLNLDNLAENYPKLRNLVRVSLRIVSNSSEEHDTLESLRKRFKGKGIGVKVIRENWMTNRVDASDFPEGRTSQASFVRTADDRTIRGRMRLVESSVPTDRGDGRWERRALL